MYVPQCLDRGQTRKQIVEALNGDEELLDVWTSFLMQYDWVEQQSGSEKWSGTPKGREWYDKIIRTLIES